MNVLIAPDSFKDSLTAEKVAEAIERGVLHCNQTAQCYTLLASDGGEGFLASVAMYLEEVHKVQIPTTDPLGRPMEGYFLWDPNEEAAYVELAMASGIERLTESERNVMETTTYGTGILIKEAIEQGAKKIYLGIGGSATNDGGMGIAEALGFRFFDEEGHQLAPKGKNLSRVIKIEAPFEEYPDVAFYAVNDVLNPLFGPQGAAYTYAKQKGASPEEIKELDLGLQNLHRVVKKSLGKEEASTPGSGAAGGTAYGLRCFLNAEYISGTEFILKLAQFESMVTENKIDFIVTGEGKIDFQTAYGKFVHGMIQAANKLSISVLGICGKLELDEQGIKDLGLRAARQVYDPSRPVSYSFENAERLVSERIENMIREELPNLIQ